MPQSAASDEISETEAVERVTKNMVALGQKRSRGRRHLKTSITIVALVIAAVNLRQYLHANAPTRLRVEVTCPKLPAPALMLGGDRWPVRSSGTSGRG